MALPTKVKFDTNLIGRIPILTGQDNYDIWRLRIQTTLSAYSVWEFVDGTLTFTAQADAADQLKWKLLDKRVLGLMASTISDSLLTHVNYEWTDPVVCPSISKALWDILKGLFGTVGIASTITQTVEPVNFNMSTVSKWILMDMDLRATHKPLHARISQAESGGQASSSSSVNRTNVIKCSPPPQNQ